MSNKKQLDLDSDDEQSLNELPINKEFSERYENYRSKEVLQRLKDKYGDQMWQSSEDEEGDEGERDRSGDDSDDESEDDEEKVERELYDENFWRVLGALKSKDDAIYDSNKRFYEESKSTENDGPSGNEKITKKEAKAVDQSAKMNLVDYHKMLLKQKSGVTEEDEQLLQQSAKQEKGYYRELDDIKQELISVANNAEDEVGDDDDLIVGKKVEIPVDTVKSADPKQFLQQKSKEDVHIGKLTTFWNSSQLTEKDRFLRDYFMNKEFLVQSDDDLESDDQPKDNLINAEDREMEAEVDSDDETQRNLVKAYESTRFHHEEEDGVVIKSYPRDIESIRDIALKQKKSEKRAERVERKKQQKEAELKKLRELKRDEVRKKIQLLEKTSGRKLSHKLKEIDIDMLVDDTEFDSDKYDEKMAALFNDDFYDDAEDDEKPNFEHDSDIDDCEYDQVGDQGLIADPRDYEGEIVEPDQDSADDLEVQEDAEDDEQMANLSKKQRMKLKKQQKLDKKLDIASKKNFGIYEDVIGGQGVRFKYRQTEANTYGLTMEEILFADDKELNQWCSLKKSQQFEDDRAEREYFEEKGKDMRLKQRIFKSLYGTEDEKKRIEQVKQNRQEQKKKKRKNKNKRSNEDDPVLDEEAVDHMEPDAKKVKLDQPEVPKTTSEDRLKAKFTGQSQARSRKGKNSSNRVGKRWAGRDNRPGHKSTSKNNRNNKEWGVHDERLKAYGVNLTKDYKSKQSQSSKKNKPKNQ